ncbi:MAG: hypothetical protein IJ551_01790 [Prevotella sp.]|nr:hypothetical protein [Prevotella sp.]
MAETDKHLLSIASAKIIGQLLKEKINAAKTEVEHEIEFSSDVLPFGGFVISPLITTGMPILASPNDSVVYDSARGIFLYRHVRSNVPTESESISVTGNDVFYSNWHDHDRYMAGEYSPWADKIYIYEGNTYVYQSGLGLVKTGEKYDLMSAEELEQGTRETGKVISAKVLKDYIDSRASSAYKMRGNMSSTVLQGSQLGQDFTKADVGAVYNITDAFTTTDSFVEGAGKNYTAGTNVMLVEMPDGSLKWDVMSGFVDLSGYVAKSEFGDVLLRNVGLSQIVNNVDLEGNNLRVYTTTSKGGSRTTVLSIATDDEVTEAVNSVLS